ncbi:MAG TPA: hypothetical protein VGP80_11000 [Gemmatimonadales bacterium]|nr:hypothetical protein [Gemmatimonadales bacterium]
MRPRHILLIALASLLAIPAGAQSPPVARIVAHVDTLHGDFLIDNQEDDYTAGGSGRYERLQETAYAFMPGAVGMAGATP